DVPTIAVPHEGQDITTAIIPGTLRRLGVAGDDNPKAWERRTAGEVFVRIDLDVRRMIDRQQAHFVEIDDFFHGLKQTETQAALAQPHSSAVHFQILRRVGNVALARGHPMADNTGTDGVRDELIAAAIPRKKNWAGTSLAVDLLDAARSAAADLYFILQDARRPEQADDICLLRAAEPSHN